MTTHQTTECPIDLEDYLKGRATKEGDCLIWNGATNKTGYGALTYRQKTYRAHRFVFMMHHGCEPISMLLHSCDNKACVNVEHLREGTHAENMREARERGQHTRGEDRYGAKLNEQAVKALRYLKSRGYTYRRLAKAYGMSEWTIRSAIKLNWSHVDG